MVARQLFSSARADWNTPLGIVQRVRKLGKGKIALDPCSNATSIVGATHQWRLPTNDGLVESWAQHRGLVYVNSPYGSAIRKWCKKACKEAEAGAEIVMLVPARTDTRWWHETASSLQAVCFIAGRLRFLGAKHPAPFPSALFYFGTHRKDFARVFDDLGWVITLSPEGPQ